MYSLVIESYEGQNFYVTCAEMNAGFLLLLNVP